MANKDNNLKSAFNELFSGKNQEDNQDHSVGGYENIIKPNQDEFFDDMNQTEQLNDMQHNLRSVNPYQETIIAGDVIIEGNISSSSKLRVLGKVTGNISSTSDVVIEGVVDGEINGNNIYLIDCVANNNIIAENDVSVTEKTQINGDVTSVQLSNGGKIIGNIKADSVSLFSKSTTLGDVLCKTIKIGEGASLKGRIETSR